MALAKAEAPIKFTVEYKDEAGKITARWHYNLEKFKNGPILVEDLDLPVKEKKKKVAKEE